ncbi:hypothetical protein A5695_10215 [Mycobacterium sp. E1747]|nr:hypothetical protein A5695_10215 [Mycobacterium sp. E1747]
MRTFWVLYTARMDGEGGDDQAALFARVKMIGQEFEGGRIPIRSLDELGRYQALVLAAAAAQWREIHDEDDLPEDFASQLDLVLSDIEDGSAVSLLERPHATPYDSFYEYGRTVVEQQIALASAESPEADVISLLAYKEFRDLGSSLRDDERMEIVAPSSHAGGVSDVVTITPEISRRIRQNLAPKFKKLLKPPRHTEYGWIVGRLTAINADEQNYTISTDTYGSINGRYKSEEILDDLKAVLDSSERAPVVRFYGRLRFVGERLDRILDVSVVQVLEIDGEPWSRRFIELASLEEDWDDEYPESKVVSFTALDGARAILQFVQSHGISQPGIFPTVSGGVSLEWATSSEVLTIEITEEAEFQLFHLTQGTTAVNVTTQTITEAYGFIGEHLQT